MRVAEAWRVALDALRANRLRSILTMLGIIIGVGAVITMIAIGSGAQAQVEEQIKALGTNLATGTVRAVVFCCLVVWLSDVARRHGLRMQL